MDNSAEKLGHSVDRRTSNAATNGGAQGKVQDK